MKEETNSAAAKTISVLAFGSVNLDKIFVLKSLPALGAHENILTAFSSLGGRATNIAWCMMNLGFEVSLAGAIGDDLLGRHEFLQFCKSGIDTSLLYVDQYHLTSVFYRFQDENDIHFSLYEAGASTKLKDAVIKMSILGGVDYFILSSAFADFDASFLIEKLPEKTKMVLALGPDLYRFRKNDLKRLMERSIILFMNEHEKSYMETHFGAAVNFPCEVVVTTQGAGGSQIYIRSTGEVIRVDAKRTSVKNALGAGDAYLAGFLFGFIYGWDVRTCGGFASAIASAALETFVAQPPANNISSIKEEFLRFQNYRASG